MPLQFTPFLGILAGIIVTLIILILSVIIVIKIKHKYGKVINSSGSDSDQNSGYKSFKFDTDKKFLKADESFGSECSGSPGLSMMSERPLECSPSPASADIQV